MFENTNSRNSGWAAFHGEIVSEARASDRGKSNSRANQTPERRTRTREHLTAAEVEALVEAAKTNRHGHRDRRQGDKLVYARTGRITLAYPLIF
jgi:hypothetical protein